MNFSFLPAKRPRKMLHTLYIIHIISFLNIQLKDDQDEAAVPIHRDNETGRMYSVNIETGESTWMDDEELDDEALQIYTDSTGTTGHRYLYSVNTSGETKWLSAQ